MNEIKEFGGFRVGQKVICILNNRASLTVGKEYTVEAIDVFNDDFDNTNTDFWLIIKNDNKSEYAYHPTRFLDKSEFRKYLIHDILK